MPPIPDLILGLWIGGGIAVLLGCLMLWAAGRADRKNYIIEKAPPLPFRLLNERDDAWVRGVVVCDQPLTAPHFGDKCVFCDYELEERVTRTVTRNGKTTTETSWRTLEHERRTTLFSLVDQGLGIRIAADVAEYEDLHSKSETVGRLRHTLRLLPVDAEASAVGSVGEGKALLEKYANIPLIVTLKTRADFIHAAERGETLWRVFGFIFGWGGLVAATYGLCGWRGWPEAYHPTLQLPNLGAAAGMALVAVVPCWMVVVYNTCVEYRARIENAWRHIDVDLQLRWDLIPKLVDTVKGYMSHERGLFEALATLRSQALQGRAQAVGAETLLVPALRRVVASLEAYPELKAEELTARLVRELTAVEEKIAFSRSFFNDTVTEYNSYVMTFPRRLVTWLAGFKPELGFTAVSLEAGSPKAPSVAPRAS